MHFTADIYDRCYNSRKFLLSATNYFATFTEYVFVMQVRERNDETKNSMNFSVFRWLLATWPKSLEFCLLWKCSRASKNGDGQDRTSSKSVAFSFTVLDFCTNIDKFARKHVTLL